MVHIKRWQKSVIFACQRWTHEKFMWTRNNIIVPLTSPMQGRSSYSKWTEWSTHIHRRDLHMWALLWEVLRKFLADYIYILWCWCQPLVLCMNQNPRSAQKQQHTSPHMKHSTHPYCNSSLCVQIQCPHGRYPGLEQTSVHLFQAQQ